MPCAFHLDRSNWKLGSECQFDVPENELIDFQQQKWCLFHLPIGEGKTGKAEWNEAKCQAFNKHIFKLIEDAKEKNKIADLSGVVFPGPFFLEKDISDKSLPGILFINAIFSGDAFFDETTFSGDAFFYGTTFSGGARFAGATFSGEASFDRATFNRAALFARATFSGIALFNGATFSGDAFFDWATFSGDTAFGGARFDEATFSGDAFFARATFSRTALFARATFSGDARFDEATFSGNARFTEAMFSGDADFSGSVKESKSSSASGVVQPSANSFSRVSFCGAGFNKRARFSNRRFLDTTDFRGGFFEVAPEFHNCSLHQDTDFSQRDFRDKKGTDDVDAARAYRTLKLAMEQVRSRSEEAMFFALEQKSIRASKRGSRWERSLSLLYAFFSDYGRNSWRPLVWLVAVYGMFLGFYCLIWYFTPDAKQSIQEVAWFGLEQVFSPFKVFRFKPSPSEEPVPLALALLGALHSVLNLSLLALFLLALRRRFRLD